MARRATPAVATAVLASLLAAAHVVVGAPVVGAPPAAAATPVALTASVDLATVRSDQAALVSRNHQPAIDAASQAVGADHAAIGAEEATLAHDRQVAATAAATLAAATRQLGADTAALTAAAAADTAAHQRLATDRTSLRALALALYTGILHPPPQGLAALMESDRQRFDRAEMAAVVEEVSGNVRRDEVVATATAARHRRAAAAVDADHATVAGAQHDADAATADQATATAQLAASQARLTADQQLLAAANASRAAALAALAGPPLAAAGLSVLGPAALGPGQLAAWFDASGFTDLTSASIDRLAGWYVGHGADEGVRGDVAFAQAVLETGGFSSPDAVGLSNFAGIGHCDSCASGWAFPSPEAGVLGQLQLLRIFADPGPGAPGLPAPVLPTLTASSQSRHGCCATWESLTGVWATDPLYGTSILALYDRMLRFALAHPRVSA